MQDTRGKTRSVATNEIHFQHLLFRRRGFAWCIGQKLGRVAKYDISEIEIAVRNFRKVVPEPARQGRVHIGDLARAAG